MSSDLRCPIGQGCLVDADCASDKCNDGNKLGRALTPDGTCTDLAQINLETGLDCGVPRHGLLLVQQQPAGRWRDRSGLRRSGL